MPFKAVMLHLCWNCVIEITVGTFEAIVCDVASLEHCELYSESIHCRVVVLVCIIVCRCLFYCALPLVIEIDQQIKLDYELS